MADTLPSRNIIRKTAFTPRFIFAFQTRSIRNACVNNLENILKRQHPYCRRHKAAIFPRKSENKISENCRNPPELRCDTAATGQSCLYWVRVRLLSQARPVMGAAKQKGLRRTSVQRDINDKCFRLFYFIFLFDGTDG